MLHRSRTRVALLAAAALIATPVLARVGSEAAATDDQIVKWNIQLDGLVGPKDDVHCVIDANLYVGFWFSDFNRKPAVILTNEFTADKDRHDATARTLVKRGYTVMTYSVPSFGDPRCGGTYGYPEWDGKIVRELVSFLGDRKPMTSGTRYNVGLMDGPGDPRVGVLGSGAGGQVALAAAAVDRRIDAIVPIGTWHDFSYSLFPNNIVGSTTPGVEKRGQSPAVYGERLAGLLQSGSLAAEQLLLDGCDPQANENCDEGSSTHGVPPSAGIPAVPQSVRNHLRRIRAATLLVQGQTDPLFNPREAAMTFTGLRRSGVPAKMVWTVARPAADLTVADRHLTGTVHAWLDRHLAKRQVSTGPRFEWQRSWTSRYAGLGDFPGLRAARLPLTGDDAAFAATPAGGSHSDNALAPGHLPASDLPGTAATFTTPPLAAAVEAVGIPTAVLRLGVMGPPLGSDPSTDLVLFAKVYDVAPDGTSTLVHRQVSAMRVSDATKSLKVALPGQVHRYEKGHRIAFVLASGDAGYAGNALPRGVTLTAADTAVYLPTVQPLRFAR